MVILRFIFCMVSILITGYVLLRLFCTDKERLPLFEVIILAFGLGSGFAGLEIFFLSFIIKQTNLAFILSIQIALLLWAIHRFKKGFFCYFDLKRRKEISFSPLKILFTALILWEIIYIFMESLSLPFMAWDAWANWGFRAKIFFIDKTVPLKLWTQLPWINHPDHLEYPLLIPFAESYVYFFLGQVYEPLIRLFCALYYAGIIGLFYFNLRKYFSDKFVLGSCVVLATIPNLLNMAHTAYMEVPFIFYMFGGVAYALRYIREEKESFLWLSGLLLGLGAWVKNEGIVFCVAVFFACSILCWQFKMGLDKKRFLFVISFIPALFYLPWAIFKHSLGIALFKVGNYSASFNNFFTSAIERLPVILNIWGANCIDPQKWNILWFVYLLLLPWFIIRPKNRLTIFLFFIILFQTAFYFGLYIVYPTSPVLDIKVVVLQTVDRLLLHLSPVALLFICRLLGEEWKIN